MIEQYHGKYFSTATRVCKASDVEVLEDRLEAAEAIIYGIKRTEQYFRKDGYHELMQRVNIYIMEAE